MYQSGDIVPELLARNYIRITEVQTGGSRLADVPMGRDNMIYNMLKALPKEFTTKPGMCWPDYAVYESRQQGRLGWTHILVYLVNKMGPAMAPIHLTKLIMEFIKSERVVSCYMLDMFRNVP